MLLSLPRKYPRSRGCCTGTRTHLHTGRIFLANFMERANDAAFDDAPESFNGIPVNRTGNVFVTAMVNGAMRLKYPHWQASPSSPPTRLVHLAPLHGKTENAIAQAASTNAEARASRSTASSRRRLSVWTLVSCASSP